MTGHSNDRILAFAHYLDEKKIPVWIRHVIVPGITFYKQYLERLGEFLGTLHNIKALDVLPYHSMGKVKYENMGMEYQLSDSPEPTKEDAVAARNIILSAYKASRLQHDKR